MIVYDKDGNPHNKEPVDVAECVNHLGWTTEPPVIESISESDTGETGELDSKKKTKATQA